MKAIISDIHGNLEALEAVLADIKQQKISDIYCLGDVIGYGPNPLECLDRVMSCKMCLMGNHDAAVLHDPEGFGASAEKAVYWTRAQLEKGGKNGPSKDRWAFLENEMLRTHREGQFLYVHGSARNPLNEYVFPEDIYNQLKMGRIFALVEHYCFQGHTHVPGVFTAGLKFLPPNEIDFRYEYGEEKALVNVGSVGQPRDGNWRSSYVILYGPGENPPASLGLPSIVKSRGWKIVFRRVEYDVEAVVKKIYDIPELDNFLGDRLREGR